MRFLLPSFLLAAALLAPCASAETPEPDAVSAAARRPAAEFFRDDAVHDLTLSFTAENLAAMEPRVSGRGDGERPSPRGPRDPGAELAKSWIKAGDMDADGRLSGPEFAGLADAWFASGAAGLSAEALAKRLAPSSANGDPPLRGANGKNGMAAAMGVEFKYVRATLSGAGVATEVGARYSGNNTYMMSRGAAKRPLKVKADEFTPGRKVFGVSKFNLRNHVNDPSAMNEALSYALYRDAGVPAPRTTYARVTLETRGATPARDRVGLYTAVENIDKDFLKDRFGVKKSAPGALFKPSTRTLFEYLGEDWAAYERAYAPAFAVGDDAKARVIAFASLVSRADDREFEAKLADYVDLDEAARFLAVTVWLSSLDSILEMGQNYYLYLEPKSGRFLLLPWDLDHSFGQWMRADTASLSIAHPWSGENRFLRRLFSSPSFRARYDARIVEFGKTLFTPEGIAARMRRLECVVRPAIAEESPAALRRHEAALRDSSGAEEAAPNPAGARRSGPGAGDPILVFMRKRVASVQAQLKGEAAPVAAPRDSLGGRGADPHAILSRALFAGMDSDKDATISRAEAKSAVVRLSADWDSDKDGFLSESELAAGLRRFLPQRTRRGPDADEFPAGGPPDDEFGPPPFGRGDMGDSGDE